jgi:hypothetical protein
MGDALYGKDTHLRESPVSARLKSQLNRALPFLGKRLCMDGGQTLA